ncbi:MAG: hypothetical protein GX221_01155 [Candidatus Riflebacteria bacterium]|nr:hypothetical protein [Candidatus Riflebacteria bacterium]
MKKKISLQDKTSEKIAARKLQEKAFAEYLVNPAASKAFDFVKTLQGYIASKAAKWQAVDMAFQDKVKEIITEILLILLEDFTAKKAPSVDAAFVYIDKKLRRLVMPYKRKEILIPAFDESLSCQSSPSPLFTYARLNSVEKIKKSARINLCSLGKLEQSLPVFLFLHVYPDIASISRIIALGEETDPSMAFERDRKRVYRFNKALRDDLQKRENIFSYDLQEWSLPERRHLAWRIIDIAPTELAFSETVLQSLAVLYDWRDSFPEIEVKDKAAALVYIRAAKEIFSLMRDFYSIEFYDDKERPEEDWAVAEEGRIRWDDGDLATDFLDLLMLNKFIPFVESHLVQESCTAIEPDSLTCERLFKTAEETLSGWFDEILSQKLKGGTN